jgi:hypothetical protein
MAESNGKVVSIPAQESIERQPYRPSASTDKVHEQIWRSLSRIISESLYQAGNFVDLAEDYDSDKGTAIRYGHLVDAAECLEIAMTHLGQLKAAVSYRLRIEDEQNTGTPGF